MVPRTRNNVILARRIARWLACADKESPEDADAGRSTAGPARCESSSIRSSRACASVTCFSYSGIRVKYVAQVKTRKKRLWRTINFGRTFRSPNILAILEPFFRCKNSYSICRTRPVVIETKEAHVHSSETILAGRVAADGQGPAPRK